MNKIKMITHKVHRVDSSVKDKMLKIKVYFKSDYLQKVPDLFKIIKTQITPRKWDRSLY
jgi:hypothetical protein